MFVFYEEKHENNEKKCVTLRADIYIKSKGFLGLKLLVLC